MYKKKKKSSSMWLTSNSFLLVSQAKNIEPPLTPLDSRICKEHLQINNKKNIVNQKRG